MQKTTTFLMFVGEQYGKAEEAMNFYVSLFDNSEVKEVTQDSLGTIALATFTLDGQEYKISDSNGPHKFNFTPSISIFVQCDTEEEIDGLFKALSEKGSVMMPMDNYGFSKKFGWTADRFGVSWQLNLR